MAEMLKSQVETGFELRLPPGLFDTTHRKISAIVSMVHVSSKFSLQDPSFTLSLQDYCGNFKHGGL